jgi:hypothetical protein
MQQQQSIDHIIGTDSNLNKTNGGGGGGGGGNGSTNASATNQNDNYLPRNPIFLNPQEEQALMIDTKRELKDYLSDQLKNFYSELTSYDPALSGFTHYNYITMVAMRNEVIIIIIIILDYLEIFFVYIASIK